MSEKLVLANINVFESKGAFDTFTEGTQIPTNEISLVGAYGLIPTDLEWKQAFSGSVTALNTLICTLPSTWKEVIIKYDWAGGSTTDSFMLIPRAGLDVTGRVCPSDSEIYVTIDNLNQVKMVNRGDSGDAILKGVYYR